MKENSNKNLNPVLNSLSDDYIYVDNEIQDAIVKVKLWKYFKKYGIAEKRTGFQMKQIVFTLIIWVFLGKESIRSFMGNLISNFFLGGKDVLYDFMKREDINWRQVTLSVSKEIYLAENLSTQTKVAFVVDDTIKNRRGKKVEGVSSHFDHTTGRVVKGQQVLQLGLAWPDGYIPVDNQIYIGSKNIQGLVKDFKDGRSAVAKDYEVALNKTKHEQLEEMVKRAMRNGINPEYLLADSWFGCKKNIKLAFDLGLTGILRMKRGNLKFRMNDNFYTLKMLYQFIKRRLEKSKDSNWKSTTLKVELNLSEDEDKPEWKTILLVFSSPKNPKKGEWAAFASTDIEMKATKVLEIYSLRWGIEVFFKEAKQSLGFLVEQTGNYASHYASINLTSIRYLLLFSAMKTRGTDYLGEIRNSISGKLEFISLASLMWELFKAVIYGALEQIAAINAGLLKTIKETIQENIESFLEKALQLDCEYLKNERKAEKLRLIV